MLVNRIIPDPAFHRPFAEAMGALAAEINQRIRRNLSRRSDLRRKFRRITGRPWRPGWRYEGLFGASRPVGNAGAGP